MRPIDIRNSNWAEMQRRLSALLIKVYHAWLSYGEGTTRQLAQRSGIDILNVRPRTTDLVGLGLVALVRSEAGEGVYRARHQEEWEAWRASSQPKVGGQLTLI